MDVVIKMRETNPWHQQCSAWYQKLQQQRVEAIEKGDPDHDALAGAFNHYLVRNDDVTGRLKSLHGAIADVMSAITDLLSNLEADTCLNQMYYDIAKTGKLQEVPSMQDVLPAQRQVIFTLLGWATQFYEPDPSPPQGVLQPLQQNHGKLSGSDGGVCRRVQRRARFDVSLTGFESLPRLIRLNRLSLPIPNTEDGLALSSSMSQTVPFYSDALLPSNVNFHSLRKVGKIIIQWTPSLCQHLDFDESSRRLLVFQYPAFCAFMCSKDARSKPLDQFYRQYLEFVAHGRIDIDEVYSEDLLCEMIQSYQVIFGQYDGAWKELRTIWKDIVPAVEPDPLLLRLVSHGWTKPTSTTISSMLKDLCIPASKSIYSARTDFPYLGSKLLKLQNYMNVQNPADLNILFHDKRDVLRYWTFWAVLYIGGISIVLSFFQLCVGIVQAVGQFM